MEIVKDNRSLLHMLVNNPHTTEWEIHARFGSFGKKAKIQVADRKGFSKKIFDEIWCCSKLHQIRELEIKEITLQLPDDGRFYVRMECFGHHSKWDHRASDFIIEVGISDVGRQAIVDMIEHFLEKES